MGHTRPLWAQLLVEAAAFALLVTSVVLLWRSNLLLFAVTLAECLFALALWHSRFDVSLFLIIGLLGSVAEVVFVASGVWRYANPTFLGMPLWFPCAFGTTGLIGGRMAQTVAALWERLSPSRPDGTDRLRRS